LRLDPKLAHGWTKLQFRIVFRGAELNVTTTADEVTIDNLGEALSLDVAGTAIEIGANATVVVPRV
jgi:trehalose/maltose hydrolase-like predicted phosphorylase